MDDERASGNETHEALMLDDDGLWVERECLLFEAGAYPDRGVTITPDDLRQIVENSPRALPVRIEHLRESPFDGALGVVTGLRAVGGRLWGTLRQPAEAWQFVQRAGARALSVALDVAGRRLAEVSFVCRPRVAAAQVFGDGNVLFRCPLETEVETAAGTGEEEPMTSVRQFAEGLMQYLRGVVGSGGDGPQDEVFAQSLATERAALAAEREAVQVRMVEQQVAELKRGGYVRATDRAEGLARALLQYGGGSVAQFGGTEAPLSALFAQFLEANGPVVPMGELARTDAMTVAGAGASDRLIALARESARREQVPYLAAFAQVSAAHPDLARAARNEALNG